MNIYYIVNYNNKLIIYSLIINCNLYLCLREEKCSKCAMYNLCSSICIMQNLEVNDSIFINDEKACLINNVMYYVIESELKSLS